MLLALPACERDATPQLIHVDDLVPREAEVGGVLEIHGSGFPQGRAAHVRFRGMLHRPGEAPVSAEIEATGTATLTTEVTVDFDDELESRFCGVGKRAAHTTFSGEVEVAFSPALEGAPPVAGSTAGVSLDVRPPTRAIADAKDDGLRTLATVGIRVDSESKAEHGLAIVSIDEGSRAQAAGIAGGDVLLSWGGVRLGSIADVALQPGAPSVRVELRRGDGPSVQSHDIETTGLAARGSVDAFVAALLLALAIGAIFGFAAPRPAWLVRLESRMAHAPRLLPNASEAIALSAAALVPWIAVTVTHADLDVVLALLAGGAAFVAAAVVSGGFRAAGRAITIVIPLVLACAIAMFGTGALRIDDAVRAQGPWPSEWQAARDPAALVLLLLAVGALAIDAGSTRVLRLAQRAMTGFSAGLLSALLLGGWSPLGASRTWTMLSGLEHLLKAWMLLAMIVSIQAAGAPGVGRVWKRIIPAGLCVACVSIAMAGLAPSAAPYLLAASAAALPILLGIAWRVIRARLAGGDAAWAPSALR
jgi:NADH-quinone oxidoreductase subunit H